jgi:thymidylate synthase (FAD)
MDPLFIVETISRTENPNQLIYRAMHQDYCSKWVVEEPVPDERKCGEIIVKNLLKGNVGHYGCLENAAIAFSTGYFPHSVMQQARTHRHLSFDVQSYRYTSENVIKVAKHELSVEEVFYLRPVGNYTDRQGKKYFYSSEMRENHIYCCQQAAKQYLKDIEAGLSEEHARGLLPFDYRQHFVVSFNMRSLMHFLDLRAKKDAQLEIQQLCELLFPHFENWSPEIAEWYKKNRWAKALLAP